MSRISLYQMDIRLEKAKSVIEEVDRYIENIELSNIDISRGSCTLVISSIVRTTEYWTLYELHTIVAARKNDITTSYLLSSSVEKHLPTTLQCTVGTTPCQWIHHEKCDKTWSCHLYTHTKRFRTAYVAIRRSLHIYGTITPELS